MSTPPTAVDGHVVTSQALGPETLYSVAWRVLEKVPYPVMTTTRHTTGIYGVPRSSLSARVKTVFLLFVLGRVWKFMEISVENVICFDKKKKKKSVFHTSVRSARTRPTWPRQVDGWFE